MIGYSQKVKEYSETLQKGDQLLPVDSSWSALVIANAGDTKCRSKKRNRIAPASFMLQLI
jgi:hypothetical protein